MFTKAILFVYTICKIQGTRSIVLGAKARHSYSNSSSIRRKLPQRQRGRMKKGEEKNRGQTRGKSLLVPVFFAFVQSWEHEGHNGRHIVTDQTQDVFVIPKIQRTLGYLCPAEENKDNTSRDVTIQHPLFCQVHLSLN